MNYDPNNQQNNQQNNSQNYQQGYQQNYQQNYQPNYQDNQQGYQQNYQQSGYQQDYQQNYQADYYQQAYQQNYQQSGYQQPAIQLSTNRSFIKFVLLSIVTCGIYGIICLYEISKDINTIASRYDNKKTMNYVVAWLLSMVTFGISVIVWSHKISSRIGCELQRRNYDYKFSASTYWIYNFVLSIVPSFVVGLITGIASSSDASSGLLALTYILSLLSAVGPYIYIYKLFKAMNLLSESYNVYG
ncbi:MAG: DUF4234 domain-containing protein [Acutalibacteraceae bacterium]|nr:DUF4234 domain-containing protein [Acutalibacteraceae bacterium]